MSKIPLDGYQFKEVLEELLKNDIEAKAEWDLTFKLKTIRESLK
ncbi:hypothetical protein BANRA_01647 [Klebsiella pneumoniae]|nr:hypothetical protein BANRA_01647 [Klebsiella pneumoniae]